MIFDDYYCDSCGNEEEVVRESIKENYNKKCSKCGGNMKKSFKTLTFSLKGNGWASKGTVGIPEPKRSIADVGYKVDHDLKKEMES